MMEKLAEYAADGLEWPLTACILDPVRASVVCSGPAEMLEVSTILNCLLLYVCLYVCACLWYLPPFF